MIIKKPYRYVKIYHDKDGKEFCDISDYVGYWLFGFIPIYLIKKDKYTTIDNSEPIREDVYKYMK